MTDYSRIPAKLRAYLVSEAERMLPEYMAVAEAQIPGYEIVRIRDSRIPIVSRFTIGYRRELQNFGIIRKVKRNELNAIVEEASRNLRFGRAKVRMRDEGPLSIAYSGSMPSGQVFWARETPVQNHLP